MTTGCLEDSNVLAITKVVETNGVVPTHGSGINRSARNANVKFSHGTYICYEEEVEETTKMDT